jgi:catalase
MPSNRRSNDLTPVEMADARILRGKGGETHQTAGADVHTLTTQQGAPVGDDQNSLKAGARGPTLMEDQHFREKIFHFDHERIPERVVHARGFGAHGYFENYRSLADITAADLLQRPGEKTPAFVRFSTVAGNKGSADLARDVRGFAVKLYTKEGNWDIVGNNIPIFFIQDAIKFPDVIHAAKQEPDRGFPQASTAHDNFWDFISLMPESMHMLMWVMSDRDPTLVPLHGGVRSPHLPPRQRARQIDLCQIPLETEARSAVGGVERGAEDKRRRPRFSSPRPVERDQQRRFPGMGTRNAVVRRGFRRQIRI